MNKIQDLHLANLSALTNPLSHRSDNNLKLIVQFVPQLESTFIDYCAFL